MPKYKLKKSKNKSHIPWRLNILFIICFMCFVALFARLAYLQLYNGKYFENIVNQTEVTKSTRLVPRGMIYDSQGKVLVGNQPELAILYTRGSSSDVSVQDIVAVAKKLTAFIEAETQDLTERDKKDYFVVTHLDEVNSRLTKAQKQLAGAEFYQAQLDAVTGDDLNFSEAELKIAALFKKMNSAYSLSTVTVKNKNVTQDEVARVAEHLDELEGISIGTDWQRIYPLNKVLRSILGEVSTEQQGLPSEQVSELLARGYTMNDRVGISYLEKSYEDVLKGTKAVYNTITNSQNNLVENQEIYEGNAGDNLVLTINTQFQTQLDLIAENALNSITGRGLNDRVYIVVTNPNNGDILGIAGKKYRYDQATDSIDYSTIEDDALGAINTSYGMGSSVKPAMVAMGYMAGVISVDNNTLIDEPMQFQASKEKSSVFNRTGQVPITDIQAIQRSSNIYMVKLAMMIGGQSSDYQENMKLAISSDTINIMRDYFAQFGLGAYTGIDLPNESTGYLPSNTQLVSALDLSYGQFDLYTPLQMAQYVSTIANGGTRYALHLVKEIRATNDDGSLGPVKTNIGAKILNEVPIEASALDRIRQGMFDASHTGQGTAQKFFMNYPVNVASKTGTAEAFYSGPIAYAQNEPVTNLTYVGYAPFDQPQIAVSVVVPYLPANIDGTESTRIAKEVMDAYFAMQQETSTLFPRSNVTPTTNE